MVSKRTGSQPKLAQLIVALPCNQIDMMRESELMIKHDTEVGHTSREGYVRICCIMYPIQSMDYGYNLNTRRSRKLLTPRQWRRQSAVHGRVRHRVYTWPSRISKGNQIILIYILLLSH